MRIIKHIPNTITSMNLLCGALGVIFTLKGRLDLAFYFMLGGAVCDFCDGLSARLLNAYSEIGKELDSLADMVTFGLLPSLILYKTMNAEPQWLSYIPLIIAVFSALRLAKFNTDDRQTENFIGLPTPACAMICGSYAYYVQADPTSILTRWAENPYFIPVASVILALLLVCEIPMFSMKFKKHMKGGTPIHRMRISFVAVIVVASILVALLGLNWSMIVLLVFVSYIVMNVGNFLIFRQKNI